VFPAPSFFHQQRVGRWRPEGQATSRLLKGFRSSSQSYSAVRPAPKGRHDYPSIQLAALEAEMAQHQVTLLTCAAVPEVEAWLLAGHLDQLSLAWTEVRSHPRLKEEVAQPFLDQANLLAPGQGREVLMRQTLRGYRRLLARCPELQVLDPDSLLPGTGRQSQDRIQRIEVSLAR